MKIINNLIERFGVDNMLHFLVGGWIVSMFSPFRWLGIIIGLLLVLILSLIKEKWLDEVFEWKEILAACIGSGVSVLIYLIMLLFL